MVLWGGVPPSPESIPTAERPRRVGPTGPSAVPAGVLGVCSKARRAPPEEHPRMGELQENPTP